MKDFISNLIAIIFISLIAISFSTIGWYSIIKNVTFISNSIETKGIVVGHEKVDDDEGGYTYSEIVEYLDLNGEKHTFVSSDASTDNPIKINKQVKVYYHKDNYSVAKLNYALYLWIFPGIFAFIGFLFLLFGVRFYLDNFSNKKYYVKNV